MNVRAACLSLVVLALVSGGGTVASANDAIVITAVPSKFTPDKIMLRVGETATLRFTRIEGVHSIASPELGIRPTVLTPASDAEITVTPSQKGTFILHCAIVCGADHANMILKIVVE